MGRKNVASGSGDIYGQAYCGLEIIHKAIRDAGGKVDDVIRTRIMSADIFRWAAAAKAHGEFFSGVAD